MENQAKTNANLAAVKKRILAEIAAIQTDGNGVFDAQTWADFGALGSRLANAGVAWKTCGVSGNFTSFMEKAFCDEAERGVIELRLNKAGKSPNSRVRLKKAPSPAAAKEPSTSANAVSPSQPKEPSTSANAVSPSQPKELSDAELKQLVLAEIAALQTNENGDRDASAWVNFSDLVPRLKAKGVDCNAFGCMSYAKLLESRFADSLQFDKSKTNVRLVRPKTMETETRQSTVPAPVAVAPTVPAPVAVAPTVPAPVAVAPTVPAPVAVAPSISAPVAAAPSQAATLSDAELKERVFEAIRKEQTDKAGVCDPTKWVYFANLGSRLRQEGVDCKAFGCASYAKLLESRFADLLQFDKSEPTAWRVRPKTQETETRQSSVLSPSQAATFSDEELKKRVWATLLSLQTDAAGRRDPSAWVDFTVLGARLKADGVDCKAFGCTSYAELLESRFAGSLQFNSLVRPKTQETETRQSSVSSPSQAATHADAELKERVWAALLSLQTDAAGRRDPSAWIDFTVLGPRLKADGVDCKAFGRASYPKLLESRFADSLQFDKSEPTAWRVRPTLIPDKNDASLADWAIVDQGQIDKLAALAFPEKWSFQNAESTRDSRFPILESYLKYTFRQLAFEGKVQIAKEVAAFNVGLFTRQYDPIFAFFRQNNGCEAQPWRLSSFAVAGEDADGKELVLRFRPLPKRARYFDRREDFVFDDEAEISRDAVHCLVERVYRLPNKFLRRYCSPKFLELEIDGETRTFDEIADKPEKDAARLQYFKALAKKLPGSNELVGMTAAFDAALEQAKKRVAANFRTAVPTFNPVKRNAYFCLPLALGDPASNPDVALVVEWIAKGVYQVHTIYTLEMAYKCARLAARLGDENWLDGGNG